MQYNIFVFKILYLFGSYLCFRIINRVFIFYFKKPSYCIYFIYCACTSIVDSIQHHVNSTVPPIGFIKTVRVGGDELIVSVLINLPLSRPTALVVGHDHQHFLQNNLHQSFELKEKNYSF